MEPRVGLGWRQVLAGGAEPSRFLCLQADEVAVQGERGTWSQVLFLSHTRKERRKTPMQPNMRLSNKLLFT